MTGRTMPRSEFLRELPTARIRSMLSTGAHPLLLRRQQRDPAPRHDGDQRLQGRAQGARRGDPAVRRAARQDANHRAIAEALTACGATVVDLSGVGAAGGHHAGCPDLLVGWRAQTMLVEIKDGAKPASKKRLTVPQRAWHAWWRGSPVHIVESLNAAINLLRVKVGDA